MLDTVVKDHDTFGPSEQPPSTPIVYTRDGASEAIYIEYDRKPKSYDWFLAILNPPGTLAFHLSRTAFPIFLLLIYSLVYIACWILWAPENVQFRLLWFVASVYAKKTSKQPSSVLLGEMSTALQQAAQALHPLKKLAPLYYILYIFYFALPLMVVYQAFVEYKKDNERVLDGSPHYSILQLCPSALDYIVALILPAAVYGKYLDNRLFIFFIAMVNRLLILELVNAIFENVVLQKLSEALRASKTIAAVFGDEQFGALKMRMDENFAGAINTVIFLACMGGFALRTVFKNIGRNE